MKKKPAPAYMIENLKGNITFMMQVFLAEHAAEYIWVNRDYWHKWRAVLVFYTRSSIAAPSQIVEKQQERQTTCHSFLEVNGDTERERDVK